MKSFEFLDFSGGITDKDVPGYTNRYSKAVNLLIDHDKKLFSRDGFDIMSSTAYQPGSQARIARMVNFDIDSEVLAFQSKAAYAIAAGAWAEVQGPGGGSSAQHAFNTNTAASLLIDTQWQHQLFVASDSGDPVVKMYRDNSAAMQLRSAGLPSFGTFDASGNDILTPSDGGLALAITLVNDLQSKMHSHYGSNAAAAGTPNNSSTGHHIADVGGLLAAQATAVATGTVPAATDLASLITLLNALRTQYSAHMTDAQGEDRSPFPDASPVFALGPARTYHMIPDTSVTVAYDPYMMVTATANTSNQPLYLFRHYLNFSISAPGYTVPSTALIKDVLHFVNDLRDKWNWHTYASMTHFNSATWQGSANYTNIGLHATSIARVEPYTWAQITPNNGAFIQFVKDLKIEFDAHRLNDSHIEDDITWVVPAAISGTPTTFTDAVTLLGWLSHCITYHALEADANFCANGVNSVIQGPYSTTSGSNTLTAQTLGGFASDLYKFMRVVPITGLSTTPFLWLLYNDTDQTKLYNVTASNTATPVVLTVANNFTGSETNKQFLLTSRHFHFGGASQLVLDSYALAAEWAAQDFGFTTAQSLQGFADLAQTLAAGLKLHTIDRLTAYPSTIGSKFTKNSQSYTRYQNALATAAASGINIMVHAGQDNTNYPVNGATGNGINLSLNSALLSANTAATQLAESRFNLAPTAVSVLYEACFKYDYHVGSKLFTNRSAPATPITAIGFLNEDYNSGGTTESGKYSATIANIYAFANAANENFAHTDTANFRKEIYRTIGDGQLFYRVDVNGISGDIQNSTTTFTDYSSDTFLPLQIELYTNDGSPENARPPAATCVHVFGNVAFYVLGNLVYQSVPREPEAVPTDFLEEFEEDVISVSSTRTVAVAFGRSRIYRLVGEFDDFGRGGLSHECIYDRTGAISAQSVVKADNGIFFAGKDGFYFTDGYQVMRVTDMEKTFRAFTLTTAQRNNIQGTYDNIAKRVYWTLQTGNGSYPDTIWVMDLQFGIKPDETPITTLSKASGFNPTALTFFNGQIYYGDGDGYTFVQTRGRNIDLVKNTAVAATLWAAEAVIWDIESCNHAYGSQSIRKYFTRVTAQWDSQGTNVSCVVGSNADKGRVVNQLPVIRSRKLTDWGDPKIDWTASVYPAKAGSIVDEWRRFNGDGSLRSNFRAVEFSTAYCVIVASKDMGTLTLANTSGALYSATLTSLVATRKWPAYSVGYFVRLNGIDYPVTVRTSDSVVTIDATALTVPTTGVVTSWELWGYPKNERIRFVGYTVDVDDADDKQTASQGAVVSGGENTAP